ncbi:MAG: acyltransferase family protein [Inhella sp.]|jgi:peptidoglycan/LPS O-acetylase OafA/YrhL|nr:acyltransferase family protein [Inhella sp.]
MTAATLSRDYRPDVDGLRAIAVLAVIAFHLWPDRVPGGYLGVDVFFVISGYLITGLALAEAERGAFDWRAFYERRARRILPALLLMLACTLAAGFVWMHAQERMALGASAAATAVWSANFYFWRNTGYFLEAANAQALLHTWSLGVEEQFYLAFPLLLWLHRRWGWSVFAAGLLASMALNALVMPTHPSASFFMLPTRAWELLAGCLLAAQQSKLRPLTPALSWLTVPALLLCFLVSTPESRLPASLLAVLLTTLILHGGAPLLRLRALVFIGLISYSLYLWHQPVLVFASLQLDRSLTGLDLLGVLPLMLLLAWASWRWVETPLRRRGGNRRRFVALAASVSAAVLTLAGLMWLHGGSLLPKSPAQDRLLREPFDFAKPYGLGQCFLTETQNASHFGDCRTQGRGAPKVLLWGDSYAAHWMPGLRSRAELYATLVQRTVSGCEPRLPRAGQSDRCSEIDRAVLASLKAQPPDLLLLSARWSDRSLQTLPELVRTARSMGIQQVLVLGPTPRWRGGIRGLLLDQGADFDHLPPTMLLPQAHQQRRLNSALQDRVEPAGGRYVDLLTALCDEGMRCPVSEDGRWPTLNTWDEGHLTSRGSESFARRITW